MDAENQTYSQVTRGISITVVPDYLEDQSEPADDHYVWMYTIRIDNQSDASVQLKNRHWTITDASGHTVEVIGDGVLGEQPVIAPGDAYEYSSGCPLATPSGLMFGHYGMETATGEAFEVGIPAFSLDSPHCRQRIH